MTGKQNWLAAGLPVEGEKASAPRAGTVARRDVPVCRPDETLGEVAARLRGTEWDACVVVNEHRVVLGMLREEELVGDEGQPVESAMKPGPSTFRPHVDIADMAEHMRQHDLKSVPITTGEGILVGLLRVEDAIRASDEAEEGSHEHGEG